MSEVNLGTLLLELGIDQTRWQQDMGQVRQQAAQAAQQIEQQFNRSIGIKPTVDFTQIHELNRLFDVKADHAVRTNEKLKLRPTVDLRELQTATNQVKVFESLTGKPIAVRIAVQGQDASLLGKIGGGMASAVGGGFKSTIGSMFTGAFENIGRELSAGVAKGLSGAIESALGQKIGSTELFSRKLTEAIGRDVKSGLGKAFEALPDTVKERLKATSKELGTISGEIVTPESALIESRAKSAKQRKRVGRDRELAREEFTIERREDLRNYRNIQGRRETVGTEKAQVIAAIDKGESLRDRLAGELSVAEFDKNKVRVEQLQNALLDVSESLAFLSQSESALTKEYVQLGRDLDAAQRPIATSKRGVEMLRTQSQPKIYQDALQAVTGGKLPQAQNIPALVVDDKRLQDANAVAMYAVESNVIYVRKALKQAIDSGMLSIEQYMTLLEEVGHAFDFDFGSTKGVDARRDNTFVTADVKPTTEEVKSVAGELQGYAPEQRALEMQAKVRARRLAPQLYQKQESDREKARVEKVVGFAGGDFAGTAQKQLASLQGITGQIQELSLKSGVAIGVGLGEFINQLENFEQKLAGVNLRLGAMNTGGNSVGLAEEVGGVQDYGDKLEAGLPELRQDFINRFKKQQVQQKRVETAESIGRGVRSVVDGAIGVAQSPPVRMAAGLIGGGVKLGYKGLQAAETVALDALPLGRTAKSIGQNFVLPAVGMTAAAHAIPAVGGLMSGAGDLATMALGPLARSMGGGVGASLASNAPAFMGIQNAIAGGVAGSVEKGLLIGAAFGGKAAMVGGGGAVIKQALALPFKAVQRVLEPAAMATPAKSAIVTLAKSAMPSGESQLAAIQAAGEGSRSAAQEAIDRSKAIAGFFVKQKNYIKAAIIAGDMSGAAEKLATIQASAASAKSELDSQKGFGVDAKINAAKGQITRSVKSVEKLFDRMTRMAGAVDDEMNSHQLNLAKSAFPARLKRPTIARSVPDAPDAELTAEQRLNLGRIRVKGSSANKIASDSEKASDQFDAAANRLSSNIGDRFNRSSQGIHSAVNAMFDVGAATEDADRSFGKTIGTLDILLGGFVAFQAIGFVVPLLAGIAKQTIGTALEFDALKRSLSFSTGQDGAAVLGQISDKAYEMGINFREAASGYAQLAAATRDTPLEGLATEQGAMAMNNVSSAFSLDKMKQNRLTTAFAQMAGKDKLSQEELRGQIGDVAPGLIGTAARSQGLSTAELNRLIKNGVSSEQFLPKFFQQINAETALASDSARQSPQASFNRLESSQEKLQASIGAGFLPVAAGGAELLAGALQLVVSKADLLLAVLTTLTVYAGGSGVAALFKLAGGAWAAGGGFLGMAGNIRMAMTAMAPMIGKFLLLTAAIEVGKSVFKAFQDGGGVFREYADSIEAGNKKIAASFAEVGGAKSKIVKREDLKGSMFGDSILGSVIGKDNVQAGEGLLQKAAMFTPIGLAAAGVNYANGGGFTIATQADKLAADRKKAFYDMQVGGNETISQVYSQLGIKGNGSLQLGKLKAIDKQIDDIQGRRAGLAVSNPTDKAGLKQLKDAEQELMKQRDLMAKPVGQLQAQLSSQIEAYKKSIDKLDDLHANGEITTDDYNKQVKELKGALSDAETAQEKFNAAMGSGLSALDKFEQGWSRIVDRLADAKSSFEDMANVSRVSAGQAELDGNLTRGQAETVGQSITQQNQAAGISEVTAAISKLRAELDAKDAAKILGNYNATNAGATELKTLSEKATAPKDKSILGKAAEIKELESQLKADQAQLTDAQVQTKRALQDSTKQVRDYYIGIAQGADRMALEAKQTRLDASMLEAQNRIKGALTKNTSSFVSSLADTWIGIIDTVGARQKIALDLQLKQLDQNQSYQNLQRSTADMQNNLPGMGGGFNGVGVAGGAGVNASSYKLWTTGGGSEQFQAGGRLRPHHNMSGAYDTSGSDTKNRLGQQVNDMTLEDANGNLNVAIPSPVSGRVVAAGRMGGYGNAVEIDTGTEKVLLAHLESIAVNVGDNIAEGMKIGIQGGTGKTGSNSDLDVHLHLESSAAVAQQYANKLASGQYKGGVVGAPTQHFEGDGHNHGNPAIAQSGGNSPLSALTVPGGGGGSMIRAVRTGLKDNYGAEILEVQNIVNGVIKDRIKAASGDPGSQKFESLGNVTSRSGERAPIPAGTYRLGAPETGDFKNAKVLGRTYIPIMDAATGSETSISGANGRNAFGLHQDADRFSGGAGSAGCVVFYDQASINKVAGWVQGGQRKLVVDYSQGEIGGMATPQPQQARSAGLNMASLTEGGGNSLLAKVIGMAEGNRTATGGITDYYKGHEDDGNGKWNIGSFSAQDNLNTGDAESSDRKVIDVLLKPLISEFTAQAQKMGVQVTPKLLFNYLDSYNQSPLAAKEATSGTTFFNGVGALRGQENNDAAILALRTKMYTSGGQTTIAGRTVEDVQAQRMGHINTALQAYGLNAGGNGGGMISPTTGMNQAGVMAAQMTADQYAANTDTLNSGLALQQQANADAMAAARQLGSAQDQAEYLKAEKGVTEFVNQLKVNTREMFATGRTLKRSEEDSQLKLLPDSPEANKKRADVQRRRDREDKTTDLSIRMEDSRSELQGLDRLSGEIANSNAGADYKARVLPGLNQRITDGKAALKEMEGIYGRIDAIDKQQGIKDEGQYQAESKQRELDTRGRSLGDEAVLTRVKVEDANRKRDPELALDLQQALDLKNKTYETDKKIFEIQELQRLKGLDANQAANEIARLKANGALELEQIGNATKEAKRSRRFDENQALITTTGDFQSARMQQLRDQKQPDQVLRMQGDIALRSQVNENFQARTKLFAEEGKYTAAAFAELNRVLNETNAIKLDNITAETQRLKDAANFGALQTKFGVENKLVDARVENTRLRGGSTEGMEKQQAIAGANLDYLASIRSIRDDANLSADEIDRLITKSGELNALKLDSIKRQFSELNQISMKAQEELGGGIADLLSGAKSLGAVLRDMIGNLGKQIATMAGQRLSKEIFGIFKSKEERAKDKQAASGQFGTVAELTDGKASSVSSQIAIAGDRFAGNVISAGGEFRAQVLAAFEGVSFGNLARGGEAAIGSVPSMLRYIKPESFADADLTNTVENDGLADRIRVIEMQVANGQRATIFDRDSKGPMTEGYFTAPTAPDLSRYGLAPSMSMFGDGGTGMALDYESFASPSLVLNDSPLGDRLRNYQPESYGMSGKFGLDPRVDLASGIKMDLPTIAQPIVDSGETFKADAATAGDSLKTTIESIRLPIPTAYGSTPFPPNVVPGGSMDFISSTPIGFSSGFGAGLPSLGGDGSDLMGFTGGLGSDLVMGARQAADDLASGVKDSSIMLADSGSSAGKGLMMGIQGLGSAFDKFGKGDTLGGILGIIGTGISVFGGGLFGGGKAEGGMVEQIANFADGGMLGAIDAAMMRERAQSGYDPVVVVANKRERILSAKQTDRFNAMGLLSVVDGGVPNYAAGGYCGPTVPNYADGGPVVGGAAVARGGNSVTVNLTVPVSGGGGDDKLAGAIQAALYQQVPPIVMDVLIREKRDGGQL